MTPRFVLGLAAATALAVAGAVWAVLDAPRTAGAARMGEVAFPALHAGPDAAARLVLDGGEGEFALERGADGAWTAPGRHGHPAAARRVREALAALADMRLVEARTRLPERYARIGVEPPGAPDSGSIRARVEDSGGRALADAIFGGRVFRRVGEARAGVFLRFPEDEQAWLASGGTDLPADPLDWLDRAIVDIPADSVARVDSAPAGAAGYVLRRGAAGESFRLLGAEGALPLDAEAARRLASGLSALAFEDVFPRGAAPAGGVAASRITFATFDGLEIAVLLSRTDGEAWADFSAAAAGGAEAAVRERARELDARLSRWTYRIAEWRRARLAVPLDRLRARDPAASGSGG